MREFGVRTDDGGELSGIDFGGDGPAVLATHYPGFGPLQLSGLADALRGRARLVALALRGHAGSTAEPVVGSADPDDFGRVAQALGLDRPVLLTQSATNSAAAAAAIARPDAFRALVLVNGLFPAVAEPHELNHENPIDEDFGPQMTERLALDTVARTPQEREELIDAITERATRDWLLDVDRDLRPEIAFGVRETEGGWIYRPTTDVLVTAFSLPTQGPHVPLRATYGRIPVPVHVVVGETSFDHPGGTDVDTLADELPGVDVTVLDAGTFPLYSHADRIAQIVLRAARDA